MFVARSSSPARIEISVDPPIWFDLNAAGGCWLEDDIELDGVGVLCPMKSQSFFTLTTDWTVICPVGSPPAICGSEANILNLDAICTLSLPRRSDFWPCGAAEGDEDDEEGDEKVRLGASCPRGVRPATIVGDHSTTRQRASLRYGATEPSRGVVPATW